jgi:methionine sulfoxide reductase heme-binding subunit
MKSKQPMQRTLNSIFLLYVIMAIPSYELLIDLIYGDRYYAQMMTTSGVMSIYLLVLSMAVTPIVLLIKRLPRGLAIGRWLLVRRRHFGLGSFYYACLHLIHYLRQINDIENVFYESLDYQLTIAWIAFLISALLAITSNNASQRLLKTKWIKLHRFVYLGAALTFAHWYLYILFPYDVFTWAAVLALIKLIHIGINYSRKRSLP